MSNLPTIEQRVELLEKQMATLLPLPVPLPIDKPVKKVKSPKKEVAPDEGKPKTKHKNGYLLFSSKMRDETKVRLSADGAKLINQDIMVELAALWNALSDEQKADWNTQAKTNDTI